MTPEDMDRHIVRYGELIPCKTAFIDTHTPGSVDQPPVHTVAFRHFYQAIAIIGYRRRRTSRHKVGATNRNRGNRIQNRNRSDTRTAIAIFVRNRKVYLI